MKNKKRKIEQRKLNKRIREMNESIEKDSLWKGRFFARQARATWYEFEDGSGGCLFTYIRFYDKKTRKYKEIYDDNYGWPHALFWTMNDFIVKDLKVWENEDVRSDDTDYTMIDSEWVVCTAEPMYDRPYTATY